MRPARSSFCSSTSSASSRVPSPGNSSIASATSWSTLSSRAPIRYGARSAPRRRRARRRRRRADADALPRRLALHLHVDPSIRSEAVDELLHVLLVALHEGLLLAHADGLDPRLVD